MKIDSGKIKGALYASAVGDAKGAPFERVPKQYWNIGATLPPAVYSEDSYESEKGWLGNKVSLGQITDDTILGLCLLESLLESKGLDMQNYSSKLISIKDYPIGFGLSTKEAIEKLSKGVNWQYSAKDSLGGGALTKWAIPIFYESTEEIISLTKKAVIITHNNNYSISCAQFLAITLNQLIKGKGKNESIDYAKNLLKFELKTDGLKEFTAPVILEKSLNSFLSSNSLTETIKNAILSSKDADTAGYVSGLLAGAYYGFDAIPAPFISGLKDAYSKIPIQSRLNSYLDRIISI